MRVSDLNSVPEILHKAAAANTSTPAVSCRGGTCEEFTFPELRDAVTRAAAWMHEGGLTPGDRVLLACESGPAWVVAFFAVLAAGGVVALVPPDTHPDAIAALGNRAGARRIITGKRAAEASPGPDALIRIGATELSSARGRSDPAPVPLSRRDLAVLALTSGTTEVPRLVELTHGALLANVEALLSVRQVGPGDKFLSMLPLAHMFELVAGLLAPLACGAHIVYAGPLLPNRIVDMIRAEQITHALGVPALVKSLYGEILSRLAESKLIDGGRRRQVSAVTARRLQSELSSDTLLGIRLGVRHEIGDAFERIMVGGAAMDPALIDVLLALGIETDVGYGLTEAGPVVAIGRSSEYPQGSVGRPLPGVVVRISAAGEIQVQSPAVMRGYFGDPEATAAVMEEGWLKTGDLGTVDDAGCLYVVGRMKEVMVTAAGETIHPDEMEPCYHSPHFSELCVAALPGPDGNDVPTLFVVPVHHDLPDCDLQQIFAGLRAAAPVRLRVEQVVRVDHPLARTPTGKVCRRLLVDAHRREINHA